MHSLAERKDGGREAADCASLIVGCSLVFWSDGAVVLSEQPPERIKLSIIEPEIEPQHGSYYFRSVPSSSSRRRCSIWGEVQSELVSLRLPEQLNRIVVFRKVSCSQLVVCLRFHGGYF